MPAFKEMIPGESLDHFHQRCVVPTPQETLERNAEIDAFVRFLHTNYNQPPYTPARVIKGGSLGKGTAVRGSADIDLVVILNGLTSIEDLRSKRPELLRRLEQEVSRYQWRGEINKGGESTFSLSYILNGQEVDVLPAIDVIGAYGCREAVYSRMDRCDGGQFSASLAPLQIEFVRPQGEDVKRVIRLLKFWKKERDVDIRSYTLELLTIHVARTTSGPVKTDRLFRDVLTLLQGCRSLKVAFNDNYDSGNYTRTLRPPYVLDPANPYMNTMYGIDAETISAEATTMLNRL